MDFLDMDGEQTPARPVRVPAAGGSAGPLSERVQGHVRAGDLFGAVRAYRQETRAGLKAALAVVKAALRAAKP